MKFITPDLIISLVVSFLLCCIFYFINKNNDPQNSVKLKVYVKWYFCSVAIMFSIFYIKKIYNTDSLIPTMVTSQSGGNYSPNIIVGEPDF
jgi:hypothetical protein